MSILILEAWEDNPEKDGDDWIDNITIPKPGTIKTFSESYSLTIEGVNRIASLTLTYHNLTTDPTPCSSNNEPGKS